MSGSESGSSPHTRLRELIGAAWTTQAIRVATDLGLPQLLLQGPQTTHDLAKVTGTHATALQQLLRALCSLDLCSEGVDGKFCVTEMGALLAEDASKSLHHWAKWFGSQGWPLYTELAHCVRTGTSARSLLLGTRGFDHLDRDPNGAETFHRAMVELTHLVSDDIVRSYDFSHTARLVDVGGGHGELLRAALLTNPKLRGTLFDRPHAMQGAQAHLEKHGVINRCSFETGDFFSALPTGADAYLLKSILHDWNDLDCVRLLKCCAAAMTASTHLLIVEQLMPTRVEPSAQHRALCASDLHMLVALGAHERNQSEFEALLDAAGLKLYSVTATPTQFSIIEARIAG
jgi:hypothetical protein